MNVEKENLCPPCPQQEGIWFHALRHGTSFWNYINVKQYKGTLDLSTLEEALLKVIQRHSSLRSNFTFRDEKLYQVIDERLESDSIFDVKILRKNETTHFWQFIQNEIDELSCLEFDFERDPLFKIKVFQNHDIYIIIFVINHIITDITSTQMFWSEWMRCYNELKGINTEKKGAFSIPRQYENYAREIGSYFETKEYKRKKTRKLASLPAEISNLDIPFISYHESYEVFVRKEIVPKSLEEAIRYFALNHRVLNSTVYLLAYFILLYKYSKNNRIVLANVVNGRGIGRNENKDVMGLFVNRLVNVLQITEQHSIKELLLTLNEELLTSLEDNIPFEDLMRSAEESGIQGLKNLQAGFNRIKLPQGSSTFFGVEEFSGEKISNSKGFNSLYDIYLYVVNEGENTYLELIVNAEKKWELMGNMVLRNYLLILESCVYQSEGLISELKFPCNTEINLLKSDFNDTLKHFDLERTVLHLFMDQVGQCPQNIALISEGKSLSYEELNDMSNGFSFKLKQKSIGRDALVGICMDRSIEMVAGILAILKVGCSFLPIDPGYPKDHILHMVENSGIKHLLTTKEYKYLFEDREELNLIVLNPGERYVEDELSYEIGGYPQKESLVYTIYTSGSTGVPKGVMIQHEALTNFLLSLKEILNPKPKFRLLSITTYSFDIFYLELFLPLISGGSVILANAEESRDARLLQNLIIKYKPNLIQGTPSTWQMMLDSGWKDPGDLWVLSGGEALKESVKNALFQIGVKRLWNLYGPTETTIWSTIEELHSEENVTIGKPISNTEIFILGPQKELLPVGVVGGLHIGGLGLAKGYYKQEKFTSEKFINNPYKPGEKMYETGDMARWLPDGRIEYIGRTDNQIKIRGHRIELGEIENVLSKSELVKECVVVSQNDRNGEICIVAYVVPQTTYNEALLKDYIRSKLPVFMHPAFWVELSQLPYTPNGKVDRSSLRKRELTAFISKTHVLPQTEEELKLVKIFERILGLKYVSLKDNFFELGGHSLSATRVISEVEREFSVSIPVRAFFNFQDIEDTGKYIRIMTHKELQSKGEFEVLGL